MGAVGAGYVLLQLLLVVPGTGLAWDETVYTSQVSGSVPAAFFSAPRARGITFLAAPVAQLTTSMTALRVWMALLSGAGLFLALWVWRALVPVRVLALAGALFATLWVTVFYGPQVMPNLWSAYGALAAAGCFLRAARDPTDRGALSGLAAGVAVTGLMRPPDAVWLVLPLAGAALLVPALRRGPWPLVAMGAGLVLGCGEWVAEAYVHYGGLAERLRTAGRIQGGMGWNVAVGDQIRALDGRALCRPCDVPWRHKVTALWWFALPPLAVGGAMVAARAGRRAAAWLPLTTGVSLAVPYLFLVDYAAPRFLLPAYALLALPVAEALHALLTPPATSAVTASNRKVRTLVPALVAAALCAHLAVQLRVAAGDVRTNRAMRATFSGAAQQLRGAGVRPPCVVSGTSSVPVAFYAGCASHEISGPDTSSTPAGVVAAARRGPVAFLVPPHLPPPAFVRTWTPLALHVPGVLSGYRAYVAPPPGR
ncbi:hypothetical protein ITX44_29640 [Streptomyces sp. KK5PA1]|uniref:Integral membrane protein n=1 Tax=Actinacidiphila acididurans TaxID=2784346 RepID=A0ABS2U3B9_9ACTN|nr:hypothetical protein [Actinacidiphila acididurans]